MQDTTDLLQIKIDNAKKRLSKETLSAIASVPWQAEILKMRETKGYTFEQLEDLEIETELALCGLVSPFDYPKELESRMRLSKVKVNELVNEMNDLVFKKIKEELIRSTEKLTQTEEEKKINAKILNSAGIEIIAEKETLPVPEKLELGTSEKPTLEERKDMLKKIENPDIFLTKTPAILSQKLSGSVKNEIVKTDHSLDNLTPSNTPSASSNKPIIDPYREIPE